MHNHSAVVIFIKYRGCRRSPINEAFGIGGCIAKAIQKCGEKNHVMILAKNIAIGIITYKQSFVNYCFVNTGQKI